MAAPKEIGRKLNGMGECRHGGVRGRKTKVGRKLLRFPPTQLIQFNITLNISRSVYLVILVLFIQSRYII